MMSLTKENVVVFNENLSLNEDHPIVQSVLSDNFECETLIIEDMDRVFSKSFRQSQSYENFMCKLGKIVNSLSFTRFLTIRLDLHQNLIDEDFIEILQHFKSLKRLKIDCSIILDESNINYIFAEMNGRLWNTNKIKFNCEPIPSWVDNNIFYWVIENIEIEFKEKNEELEVMIRPLSIREYFKKDENRFDMDSIREYFNNDENRCELNCNRNHGVYKCDSVTEVTIGYDKFARCQKYMDSFFNSFSSIKDLVLEMPLERILKNNELLSIFQQLESCSFQCETSEVNWSILPKMKTLYIHFNKASIDNFEKCMQSFPNLESLRLYIVQGLASDDCLKIIRKHLRSLIDLDFSAAEGHLTSAGLQLFIGNFQQLETLSFTSHERTEEIQKLFEHLKHLTNINCGKRTFNRNSSSSEEKQETLVMETEEVEPCIKINNLPIEMLEKIFTKLEPSEQFTCRLVCSYWFNIISTSTKLYRLLDLSDTYLSSDTNPVLNLLTTEFKYNRMHITRSTKFATDQNLTNFWEKIGKEIEEIQLDGHFLTFEDAFTTGLLSSHLPKFKRLIVNYFFYINRLLFKDIPECISLFKRLKVLIFTGNEFVKYKPDHIVPDFVFEMTSLEELEIYYNVKGIFNYLNHITTPNIKKLTVFSELYVIRDSPEVSTIKSLFRETKLNYELLKFLFIGQYEPWLLDDFELIQKSCPYLNSLVVCSLNKIFERSFSDQICKMLFENLNYLCEIYFLKYGSSMNAISQRMRYTRKNTNDFEVSFEPYPLYDDICFKKIVKYGRP